jgi:hypothetical protein
MTLRGFLGSHIGIPSASTCIGTPTCLARSSISAVVDQACGCDPKSSDGTLNRSSAAERDPSGARCVDHVPRRRWRCRGCAVRPLNREAVSLSCPQPTTLVRRETNFPGWGAEIDGRPVAVRGAGPLFHAVQVGKGSHLIRFSYRPPHVLGICRLLPGTRHADSGDCPPLEHVWARRGKARRAVRPVRARKES